MASSISPKQTNGKGLNKDSPRRKLASSFPGQSNDALAAKCAKELNKLRSNCRKTLQQDLTRLYEEESFADLFIEGDSFRKACHSCLLITRTPDFYNSLLNFKTSVLPRHSGRFGQDLNHYRVPSSIDPQQLLPFLQKVYCNEDIGQEEGIITGQLRFHISQNSTMAEPVIDKKSFSSQGDADLLLMKEDSLENIRDAAQKEMSDQDSLKPADSLELVTDSLNNVSLSSEDRNHDHQSTDYEDSLAPGPRDRDDNGGLTSSGSSQMVRSGTFDLLSSIQLEDQSNPVEVADCEEQISLEGTLRHRIDSLELNLNQDRSASPNKDSLDGDDDKDADTGIVGDDGNDGDAVTPVAEAPNCMPTRSQSSSLFQFFVDMDSLSNAAAKSEKKEDSMTGSGFMFIDLNSVDEDNKSRTIERDKNKTKDKRVPEIKPEETRPNHSKFQGPQPRSRLNSAQSHDDITSKVSSSPKPSANRALNLRRRASSSAVKTPASKLRSAKSMASQTSNSASPMSSMDSGMLSSLNSEGVQADDEDWLFRVHTKPRRKTGSLWSTEDIKGGRRNDVKPYEVDDLINLDPEDNDPLKDEEISKRTIVSCSKLGEDLLQMFYNEINADITIKAEDRLLKAHKCILIARSPYFSAMFSGEWSDSKTSFISLQGFSYNSVHFALCHIYSGVLAFPKEASINLAELALLSNLLALDTLRDLVVYELEKTYCHFFHKPCQECIVGVVDCLIVSSECGFTHLHQRCLSWVGKNFLRLWPTRSFACLPSSLINSCFHSTLNQMAPENIIETLLSCDRLAKTTPKVKWAEPIFSLIGKLMEDSCNYVASNYDLIVATNAFISLGRGNSWNISALEETFLAAMNNLTPDIACKTLVKLGDIISIAETEEAFGYGPYADAYVTLVRKMYRHCERYLVHNISQVVHCSSWPVISPETQQRIKDSAIIVFEFDKPLAPRPHLSSSQFRSMRKKKLEASEMSKSTSNVKESRSSRMKSESRSQGTRTSNDHIYDEVSYESLNFSETAFSLNESTCSDNSRLRKNRPEKKSQVAKVSPFAYKLSNTAASTGDIVAEIDAESLTVNNCLQQAKLLEQELSRKLQKQESRGRSPHSTPGRITPRGQVSSRSRNSSSASRSLSSRPPFK